MDYNPKKDTPNIWRIYRHGFAYMEHAIHIFTGECEHPLLLPKQVENVYRQIIGTELMQERCIAYYHLGKEKGNKAAWKLALKEMEKSFSQLTAEEIYSKIV